MGFLLGFQAPTRAIRWGWSTMIFPAAGRNYLEVHPE